MFSCAILFSIISIYNKTFRRCLRHSDGEPVIPTVGGISTVKRTAFWDSALRSE
jgi:hypothetical protein